MTSQDRTSKNSIDRRNAIKGIAAGAAAGVVWSAPKVEGLSMRPLFAQAQSGPGFASFPIGSVSAGNGATTSTFVSVIDMCSGTGSIQVRVRKDFVNNPRNISVQVNPFAGGNGPVGNNGSAIAAAATLNPAALLPGGLAGANTNPNQGYAFTGVLATDAACNLTIPFNCF